MIEDLQTIRRCPRNSVPFRTNYNEENGTLSAMRPTICACMMRNADFCLVVTTSWEELLPIIRFGVHLGQFKLII